MYRIGQRAQIAYFSTGEMTEQQMFDRTCVNNYKHSSNTTTAYFKRQKFNLSNECFTLRP